MKEGAQVKPTHRANAETCAMEGYKLSQTGKIYHHSIDINLS